MYVLLQDFWLKIRRFSPLKVQNGSDAREGARGVGLVGVSVCYPELDRSWGFGFRVSGVGCWAYG